MLSEFSNRDECKDTILIYFQNYQVRKQIVDMKANLP